MRRYLMFFSYLGTGFSGLQKQSGKKLKTIVSVLEEALSHLRPSNPIHITTSSRTDKDVHALQNTVHFDLVHRNEGIEYDPKVITLLMNNRMHFSKEPIRIIKTIKVHDTFHSRYYAKGRSYVYRIAISKDPNNLDCPYSPLEYGHSFLIREPMDMKLVSEAATLLTGTHDFSAFTTPSVLTNNPWINPVKSMNISVNKGHGFMEQHMPFYTDEIEHWDLEFSAGSFLFHQVRKMTAVILAIGRGVVSLEQVKEMLEQPKDAYIREQSIYDIPAYALYLKNVHYDEKYFEIPLDGSSETNRLENLNTFSYHPARAQ